METFLVLFKKHILFVFVRVTCERYYILTAKRNYTCDYFACFQIKTMRSFDTKMFAKTNF